MNVGTERLTVIVTYLALPLFSYFNPDYVFTHYRVKPAETNAECSFPVGFSKLRLSQNVLTQPLRNRR